MKKLVICFYLLLMPGFAYSETSGTYSPNDLLHQKRDTNSTPCATAIFNKALADNANMILNPETADTDEINTWTHYSFSNPGVLSAVLNCPELQNINDEDLIIFDTVSYTFPHGRKIDVNYETQKKVLQQRLKLSSKRDLPSGDISPDIYSDAVNGVVWANVDPAWYAILIAEHGTFDEFVGPDKNNVVALRYIEDNIRSLYPKDHAPMFHAQCTSKTAWAGDTDMINRATTITVGGDPDIPSETEQEKEQEKQAKSNDFYVMGDGDLSWVMYAEIAADVILTVLTDGIYAGIKGAAVSARGARIIKIATKALDILKSSKYVTKYNRAKLSAVSLERALKGLDKMDDSAKYINQFSKNSEKTIKSLEAELDFLKANKGSAKEIREVEKELETVRKYSQKASEAAKTADKIKDTERELKEAQKLNPGKAKQLERELKDLKNTYSDQLKSVKKLQGSQIKQLESFDDVKKYKDLVQAKRDAAHTLYLLRQGKRAFQAKRGLLPVRAFKAARSLRKGFKNAKKMDKAAKVVRTNISGFSAKVNDWLFHSTMQNIPALGRIPAWAAKVNMVVKIAGGLYDKTDTSTAEFTNNIDMKPYLLLGADNLEGYEDVINYGMWLFWAGSSTSAADDDAAFLQAMDFAEKFHQDLVELQDETNVMACDVDIFVVRPIIRNPGTDNEELYYLFMNDTPWTTNGYNEPNDGSEPATIPLRSTDSAGNVSSGGGNTSLDNLGNNGSNSVGATNKPHDPGSGSSTGTTDNKNITFKNTGGIAYSEPKYDGTKIGQSCTPPSTQTGNFTTDVLTTGRYSNYPAFEKAMITKFRTEGGCSDHPADRGGYTCYGVSSKYFPQVKNPGFSRADAEDIAFENFFKKPHLDRLPDAISGDVFMALWGTGSRAKSIGLLQNILGVPQTNIVDDATVNAAKNYTGDLRTQFLDRREAQFKSGQQEFVRGWLNGLELYRANGCHTITAGN